MQRDSLAAKTRDLAPYTTAAAAALTGPDACAGLAPRRAGYRAAACAATHAPGHDAAARWAARRGLRVPCSRRVTVMLGCRPDELLLKRGATAGNLAPALHHRYRTASSTATASGARTPPAADYPSVVPLSSFPALTRLAIAATLHDAADATHHRAVPDEDAQ